MKPVPQSFVVANLAGEEIRLSAVQCETLVELALRGSGGRFDMTALEDLCRLGMTEVDRTTRRLRLTEDGEEVYRQLARGQS